MVKRSSKTTAPGPPPAFDVLAEVASLVHACGLSLTALGQVDAAALLAQASRDLATDLVHAPAAHRAALRHAAFTGYVAALGRGCQLGAGAVETWRSQLLEVLGDALEAGELGPDAYGYLLGLLLPGRHLAVHDDVRVH
jgi:hypothetical protein